MPIMWRYLINNYLQIFFLTVIAFIAILLTSRLEEIAHFASFGAEFKLILLFTLLQIPYILPIAIPVACLIASILIMQRLSLNHELTALRSAGFSLKELTAPLILTSAFLVLLNFYIVSELATLSHLKTNMLKSELRSINPLLLLHNKHLMRLKGIYYDVLGQSKMGQLANDVVIAMPNGKKNHLDLFLAKQLRANDEEIDSKNLAFLSPFDQKQEGFTDLLLETVSSSSSAIQDFSHFIQKKTSHIAPDHLTLSLLLFRLNEDKQNLAALTPSEVNGPLRKTMMKSITLSLSEIGRRISAGLAPLSFTLLGIAFGMSLSRLQNAYKLFFPISLAALYLICFFAAKALETQVLLAYFLYLCPHLLIVGTSIRKMDKISHGIDV